MGKLALVLIAPLVLAASSFIAPVTASAAIATTARPVPGPHTGAHSAVSTAPLTGTRTSVSSANTCDGGFDAVASPNSSLGNDIFATAAISPNDVWAVGASNLSGPTGIDRTLAEHWNGSSWSIVPTPNPSSTFFGDLSDVAAISTNDVWAVGFYQYDSLGDLHTFAEHWNGSSWSLTTATYNPTSFSALLAVTAISSTNVWAVGTYVDPLDNLEFTLAERWNGSSWVAASPTASGFDSQLFSVSAFNASDIWAVGSQESSASGPLQPLAMHWDGASWTQFNPAGISGQTEIIWVDALEAGHAVGVGYGNFAQNVSTRQSEVWDLNTGGTFSTSFLSPPGSGSGDNALLGLDRSGSAVWAVGYWRSGLTTPRESLAIPATWNATTHTLTWGSAGTSASPATNNNVLEAVSAVSPYNFWAAGFQNSGGNDQTLIESYCALRFSLSAPASTPSGSPFSLTVTAATGSGAPAIAYRGTVHFTSTDPHATLPADYTFVPGDAGMHTFSGVTLVTPCQQTITAADMVMPLTVPSSATMTVVLGMCQAPAGTTPARGTNQGGAGTPGGRTINQSGAGTPGPRLPIGGQVERSGPSGAAPSVAASGVAAPKAGGAGSPAEKTAPQSGMHTVTAPRRETSITPADPVQSRLVPSHPVLPPPDRAPWWLLLSLLVLPLGVAGLRRRRSKEKSNA
jgi:hypothetical protein